MGEEVRDRWSGSQGVSEPGLSLVSRATQSAWFMAATQGRTEEGLAKSQVKLLLSGSRQ